MANTDQDFNILKKRFIELSNKSYLENVYTFTGFLSLAEQDAFYETRSEIAGISFEMNGGGPECERRVLRFGSIKDFGYDSVYPIKCILIKPLTEKFAQVLSHRDYLGALMNLGIERHTLGDIIIKGKSAYLYCLETVAEYIVDNLTKIRHNNVSCSIYDGVVENLVGEKEEKTYQVSSERIDGVVAKVFGLSRSAAIECFRAKHVFIGGRLCENNSAILKKEDVITVRGYGKFIYDGMTHITRKGKLNIVVRLYV